MISIAYVNGYEQEPLLSSPYQNFINEIECLSESVDSLYKEYLKIVSDATFESTMNENVDSDKMAIFEAEGDNIFAKIGNGVIKIIQTLIEYIKNFTESFKNIGFQNKSKINKIEALCKQHPDLKERIIAHSDDFDMSTVKNLSDLNKQFEEIMKMDNPSKIEVATKKLETIGKGVAVVGTIVGGGYSIYKAINAIKDRRRTAESELVKSHKILTDAESKIDKMVKDNRNVNVDELNEMKKSLNVFSKKIAETTKKLSVSEQLEVNKILSYVETQSQGQGRNSRH